MKRKNLLLAAVITGLIALLLSIVQFFVEYADAETFEKVLLWVISGCQISFIIAMYLSYKKELKKNNNPQKKE